MRAVRSAAVLLAGVFAGTVRAQVTRVLDFSQNTYSFEVPSISGDGRLVAWASRNALVPKDTNHVADVYVRDLVTGATERVSVGTGGVQANDRSGAPSISSDGRFVAFTSVASNLQLGDDNGFQDVFLHDRRTGITVLASVGSGGEAADQQSIAPKLSADGRFVAFSSAASTLVPGDTNQVSDVFVHDRLTGATERCSVSTAGVQGSDRSYLPSISGDGRFVAFVSDASTLVAGDTNSTADVFVRDRQLGTTVRITIGSPQAYSFTVECAPSLSFDGRLVAFDWSLCDDCDREAYVFDRQIGALELVSVRTVGGPSHGVAFNPQISLDGSTVVFDSVSSDLVPGDTNPGFDVFVRDRVRGTTECVSVSSQGAHGSGDSGGWFFVGGDRLSADGRIVGFGSDMTNLAPGSGDFGAIYLRDRAHPEPPSLCEPGFSGVVACPCANPPSGGDRGCDNSSASGGARLAIGGGEYLASDSLFFAVTGAKPNATSIVLQGSRPRSNGAIFGQGVRCAGGIVKALYVRTTESDGTLIVPVTAAGDPTVHERAAALGDPISPMQARWYQALYRDPIVLGGCPASATFNATQAREVLWLP